MHIIYIVISINNNCSLLLIIVNEYKISRYYYYYYFLSINFISKNFFYQKFHQCLYLLLIR